MNSDTTYNSNQKDIINLNNIFFEDSFTDLINDLNKAIISLYRKYKPSITKFNQLITPFELNLSELSTIASKSESEFIHIVKNLTIIKDNFMNITKEIDNNIEIFKESAKKIFQEMKIQKKNKVEEIYNDYARKHSLKNEQQKTDLNLRRKSNMNRDLRRNKTQNDVNNISEKLGLIKNLINKLGEYNLIIKNHSETDSDNFNKIQKQLLFEINKFFKIKTMKNIDTKSISQAKSEDVNPFIMVNNNSNNVTMTTTNNNSYYNIIDKDNIKEFKTNNVPHQENLENKNNILEKKIKEYEEEMTKLKDEYELKFKTLNDRNTSLSKDLVNKNHEIQILQNSNKLKINELTKMKLILKTNERQLKVQKEKVEKLREKSPGIIKIKDILGKKKENTENNQINDNKQQMDKLEEEIKILKDTLGKKDENISDLEKDMSDINDKNKVLKNEINLKDIKINSDDKIINNLKSEKQKLINKIKEQKILVESLQMQINTLKLQIKEMVRQQNENYGSNANKKSDKKTELKKQNNELLLEIKNLQYQLEYELNFNKQLKSEIKEKNIQIDGLNIFINKLMAEKEKNYLKKESQDEIINNFESHKRVNTDSNHKMEDENFSKKNKIGNFEYKTDNSNSPEIHNKKKDKELNKSAEIKKLD